jgi:hypothetical protein
MTHARNIWVAIALEVLRKNLGWSRKDVVKYCLADIVGRAL